MVSRDPTDLDVDVNWNKGRGQMGFMVLPLQGLSTLALIPLKGFATSHQLSVIFAGLACQDSGR